MIAYINTKDKMFDKSCSIILNHYGYTINSNNPDILILEFDIWKQTRNSLSTNTLVVIISSTKFIKSRLPPEILFYARPIDIEFVVEEIVDIHKKILEDMANGVLY